MSGRPVRHTVGITGEITLQGEALRFHLVMTIGEVLELALEPEPALAEPLAA